MSMSFDFEVDKFPSINMDTELDKLYNLEENNFNTYYTPPNELTDFISNSLSCLFVKDNLNSSEDQIANINALYKNKLQTSLLDTNKELSKIPESNKDISKNNYFDESQINIFINKFNISKEMKSNLHLQNDLKCYIIQLIKKELEITSIKRGKMVKIKIDDGIIVKRGRKLNQDTTNRNHNKYTPDNIMSKIINKTSESIFNFINKLINILYKDEDKIIILNELNLSKLISTKNLMKMIKKTNYNFILNLRKKDKILKLLNSPLKNHLSKEISNKFNKNNFPKNYNALIIEKLLRDENNKKIFKLILEDLKIEDYIDIFIHKKSFKDIPSYSLLNKAQKELLKENSEKIEKYKDKIFQNDKKYFHAFCLIIYNLRRYLENKESRKRNKNEQKNIFKTSLCVQKNDEIQK